MDHTPRPLRGEQAGELPALELWDDLADAVEERALVCVTGPEGVVGVVTAALDELRARPVLVDVPAGATTGQFDDVLHEAAVPHGGPRPSGRAEADRALDRVLRRGRPVVVPGADQLRAAVLERLITLWKHTPGRFPLILTGAPRLSEVMQRARFDSLVLLWHRLEP